MREALIDQIKTTGGDAAIAFGSSGGDQMVGVGMVPEAQALVRLAPGESFDARALQP